MDWLDDSPSKLTELTELTGVCRLSQPCLAVAEDAPDYGLAADSSSEAPPSDAPPTEKSASRVSPAVERRMSEGMNLRLAAAFVEGARQSAWDSAAHSATGSASDQAASSGNLHAMVARATVRNETDAEVEPAADTPLNAIELRKHMTRLARGADRDQALLLQLLVQFDDAQLHLQDGCRSMAVWMDVYLGIGRVAAFERLRVGRALVELPILQSLFSLGQISFSQLREITRHASAATDAEFAVAALELSVTETIEYCRRFRHREDRDEDERIAELNSRDAAEANAAHRAFERRSLSMKKIDAHSTRITIDLPDDLAAEFLRSLEQAEDWIKEGGECEDGAATESATESANAAIDPIQTMEPSIEQRRADAAILMNRRSLAHAGEAVAMADRYRVHVNVDVRLLADGPPSDMRQGIPIERPQLQGHGPICRATAKRLAEQAGFTLLATDDDNQVIGTARKAPQFSKRQLNALRGRDRCCQMPGCGATRHLDGHHVVHRENGGHSGLDNAALLCSSCHRLLHEGGFRLAPVGPNGLVPEVDTSELLDSCGIDADTRTRAREKRGCVQKFRLFDRAGRELGRLRGDGLVFTRSN